MNKLLVASLGTLFFSQSYAFECYFTLAKDSCWKNYDVTVEVIDAIENKSVLQVTVPKGKAWVRQQFTCQPAQKLMYKATYKPVFWQSEVGKVYMAKKYWTLPAQIESGQTAWDISVCYPSAFSGVPLPPDASGQCMCDFNSIPKVEPQPAS